MKELIWKCVIKPNLKTTKMRSIKWRVKFGPHAIIDMTKNPPTIEIIPFTPPPKQKRAKKRA